MLKESLSNQISSFRVTTGTSEHPYISNNKTSRPKNQHPHQATHATHTSCQQTTQTSPTNRLPLSTNEDFLYYSINFVLILSVSLLQNRFRIDSVGFFTTGSISYSFCPILYYRIEFVVILLVSLLQDPVRIDSVRFFTTESISY